MWVVVFTTIANENLPDTSNVMLLTFIYITQQTAMTNRDPLWVSSANSGKSKQPAV